MKSYRGNMGSGKSVPRSGTYGFFHAHSSAHQITLLKGRIFPFCPKCSDPVEFVLIRAVPVRISFGSVSFVVKCTAVTSLHQTIARLEPE